MLRSTRRGLETWQGRNASTPAGAPVLDPTCERLGVQFPGPTRQTASCERGLQATARQERIESRRWLLVRASRSGILVTPHQPRRMTMETEAQTIASAPRREPWNKGKEFAGSPVAESGLASPGPPQKRAVRAKAPRSCAAAACQLRRGRGKRRGFHSCVVATSRKAEQRSAGATSPKAAIRSGACGKFSLMGKTSVHRTVMIRGRDFQLLKCHVVAAKSVHSIPAATRQLTR
jgi:hypothetical protein